MKDLISRQELIDRCNRVIKYGIPDDNGLHQISVETVLDVVKNLPPETTQKTGKWIIKDGIYGVAYCNLCDYELHTNDTNFCPNCGAKMQKEE